jgi:HAD superfamily hydrolase (TIGR01490 family)
LSPDVVHDPSSVCPPAEAAASPATRPGRGWTVIVLAGDRDGDPLALSLGVSRKALVPVGGIPMLLRVLAALDCQPGIAEILVLANRVEELAEAPALADYRQRNGAALRFVEGSGSPVRSLLALIDHAEIAAPALVVTADSPLLNATAIAEFMTRAESIRADMAVGMVPEERVLAAFPGMARTYFRLKDGAFKSINMFAFLTPRAWHVLAFWRETERARKRPWQLVGQFGLAALVKVLCGRMSLAESFAHGSRVIGIEIQALPIEDGALAADVDQPQHLRAVEGALLRAQLRQAGTRRVFAVFDLDRTLTRFGTYSPFLLYAAARLKPWRLPMAVPVLLAMAAHRLGLIDRDGLKVLMQRWMLGSVPMASIMPVVDGFAAWIVRSGLRRRTLNAIARERKAGSTTVLATAAFGLYANAIAARLGFDHVVATEARVVDGVWRPGICGGNCYGEEKRRRLAAWFDAQNGAADRYVTFYTDDRSDSPLLAAADEPVVVNPKRGFARTARARGWPVVEW